MTKILLVDDESNIEKVVHALVADAGYDFTYASDGQEALDVVEREQPDLIVMDVMLPQIDGFTACRTLRSHGNTTPIIFLSAKGDIVDKGVGFSAGGDDYMVKPFDPRELMMHIEAQLRRAAILPVSKATHDDVLEIGRLKIDTLQFRLTKSGKHIPLTPKEYSILLFLAENPGVVLSREQLVEEVWGKEFVGEVSSITVFIKKLRAKIEDDPVNPTIIQTVWGIGYRFDPDACLEPNEG